MEELYKTGDDHIKPNVASYTIVMNGWSKSGSPKKLERISSVFQRMCDMYKSGNQDAEPNYISLATFIDTIAKSGEKGYAERGEEMLCRMMELYEDGNVHMKPNARLITSVMNGCARSGARNRGENVEALLDWMLDVYAKEEDPIYRPNAVSFNTGKSYAYIRGGSYARSFANFNAHIIICSNLCMGQVSSAWHSLSCKGGSSEDDFYV